MLNKLKKLFGGSSAPSAKAESPVANKLALDYWPDSVIKEICNTELSAKKIKASSPIIRKTMEKTGWNAHETFCRMLEMAEESGLSFSKLFKQEAYKEYKDKAASILIGDMEAAEKRDIGFNKDAFDKAFYTPAQLEAIEEIRNGIITVDTLQKYLPVTLPPEILAIKGDIRKVLSMKLPTLKKGDIFVCVPGKYIVEGSLRRIKPACVIGYSSYRETVEKAGIPFIPCKQIGSYVLDLAGMWKQNFDAKTIAITGSVGKTSTTDMIGNVVSSSLEMHKVIGNQNTTWQIADFVFGLKDTTQAFVQECSGSFPTQMEKTSRVVQPDIFVLTNIGNGHIGRYDGRQERLLYEKLGLDRHAADGAIGIVNKDDAILSRISYCHPVVGFSMKDSNAEFFSSDVVEKDGTISFNIVEKDGNVTPVVLNAVGSHNVYNALAAFAVGVQLGIDRAVIADALTKFETDGARQNLVTYGGQKLYLDCCSATEESVKSAIMAMETITVPEGKRKIAVLADVQMLGDQSEEIHRRIGQLLVKAKTADEIYFYGTEMKYAMEEAEKGGMKCRISEDPKVIEKWIREETFDEELIAFKAGHVMACQWIIDNLYGTDLYLHDKFTQNAPIVKDENKEYKCIEEYGCALVSTDKKEKTVTIPESVNGFPVRIIDSGVFKNSKAEEVTVPGFVTCISENAFKEAVKLKTINLPASVLYIGSGAFAGCTGLEEIDLSKGCVTIDVHAFEECTNLKRVILPENAKTIDDDAFDTDVDITFCCKTGTYAEDWAKANGFKTEEY